MPASSPNFEAKTYAVESLCLLQPTGETNQSKKKQEKITQYFPKFNGTRKTASKVGWDCCKIRKKQDTKNIQKHVLQV